MPLFSSLPKHILPLLFFIMYSFSACAPFTVIMPDSGTLLDGPQTGFSMNRNGAHTDAREQEAVYDVMRATGNEWATQIPDVCRGRWHGIECMPDDDNVFHVVSLSFGSLSDDTAFPECDPTRSHISKSVTGLPHLRTLFFYRCFIYNPQPIPSFLGDLGSTLQTLVLRENGHVGPIPNEVTNLIHLKVLDLHRNNLNGSIPVSLNRLTGLRSLDLSGNRLNGYIPGLNLPVLNVLDLNQNHFMGSIPPSIGLSCNSLIKMDFSRNRLSGPIPDSINGLKDLILMDLSFNRLTGPLPISFKNLSSLQALILKGNPMTSTTISNDAFEGMNNLMILILSNMYLTGPMPESLGTILSLCVVHLDGNNFNGSIPVTFRGLKNLNELRLDDNRLTGKVPLEREMVWRMRGKLKLGNNSGLCYDENSGIDSSNELGIGYCGTTKAGIARTVQHESNIAANEESFAIMHKSSLLTGLLLHLIISLLLISYFQ